MSIEIKTKDFVRAMGHVAGARGRRSAVPSLLTTRLRVGIESLNLTCTDLDIGIQATVPAAGTAGVEIDQLLQKPDAVAKSVKASGADRIRIANGDDRIKVEAGDLNLNVPSLPPEDIPEMVIDDTRKVWSTTFGGEAIAAIRRALGAVSTEDTRYYLNGVYIEPDGEWGLRAVATDGHRLYVAPFNAPDAVGDIPNGGVIIPHKAVRQLLRLAPKDKPISVRIGQRHQRNRESASQNLSHAPAPYIDFDMPDAGTRLTSKLIDGTFPDYKRVIPETVARTATFDRADLLRAVKSIHTGAGQLQRAIRIDFEDGACSLSCRWDAIDANAETRLNCDGDCGGMTFGVNARYIGEALELFRSCERVMLAFSDGKATSMATGPVKIVSPEDDAFLAVVMPMRGV